MEGMTDHRKLSSILGGPRDENLKSAGLGVVGMWLAFLLRWHRANREGGAKGVSAGFRTKVEFGTLVVELTSTGVSISSANASSQVHEGIPVFHVQVADEPKITLTEPRFESPSKETLPSLDVPVAHRTSAKMREQRLNTSSVISVPSSMFAEVLSQRLKLSVSVLPIAVGAIAAILVAGLMGFPGWFYVSLVGAGYFVYRYISELDNPNTATLVIYSFEDDWKAAYGKLCESLQKLARAERMWYTGPPFPTNERTTADRLRARVLGAPRNILANVNVFGISVYDGVLYFFPDFALVLSSGGLKRIEYIYLKTSTYRRRFVETKGELRDAVPAGRWWIEGRPDPLMPTTSYPMYWYQVIELETIDGEFTTRWEVSDQKAAFTFVQAVKEYRNRFRGGTASAESTTYSQEVFTQSPDD